MWMQTPGDSLGRTLRTAYGVGPKVTAITAPPSAGWPSDRCVAGAGGGSGGGWGAWE